jgi:hypothetical protein
LSLVGLHGLWVFTNTDAFKKKRQLRTLLTPMRIVKPITRDETGGNGLRPFVTCGMQCIFRFFENNEIFYYLRKEQISTLFFWIAAFINSGFSR